MHDRLAPYSAPVHTRPRRRTVVTRGFLTLGVLAAVALSHPRRLRWLWRAVDEQGQTLDVLLQEHRDTAAAERFFRRLLVVAHGVAPERITTDTLGSYAAALMRLPEMQWVEHLQVGSALRCNNRVEQAHQPTRVRERVMRRFKSVASAQRILDACTRMGNLFRPGRHRLTAAAYRATMRERVATWLDVTGLQAA